MRFVRSRCAAAVVLALLGGGLAACDPMPMIRLKNDTMLGATVRFQTSDGGYMERAYKVAPQRTVRFPAGFTLNQRLVLSSGACETILPLIPGGVVDPGYGAVTPFRLGPDGRLYLDRSETSPQPDGWPLTPVSRTCR